MYIKYYKAVDNYLKTVLNTILVASTWLYKVIKCSFCAYKIGNEIF